MMSLTFGLFTQVSGSGPLGPLVFCPFHHGPQKPEFSFIRLETPNLLERTLLPWKANRKSQRLLLVSETWRCVVSIHFDIFCPLEIC